MITPASPASPSPASTSPASTSPASTPVSRRSASPSPASNVSKLFRIADRRHRPASERRIQRAAASIAVMALCGVPVACGLPADGAAVPIATQEIPSQLRNTTTSPTSTSTTTPSPPPTTTPTTPASTDPARSPVPVTVYYATPGSSEAMRSYRTLIDPPGNLRALIELLEQPPEEALSEGLRTAVRPGLIVSFSIDRGTATVELDQEALNVMPDYQDRRAIAQIVLTLTSFAPPGQGGIGLISFSMNGEQMSVNLPGVGTTDRGEGVAFSDFRSLIGASVNTVPTPTQPTSPQVDSATVPSTSSSPASTSGS